MDLVDAQIAKRRGEPSFAAAHVHRSQWFLSGFSHTKAATTTCCVGMKTVSPGGYSSNDTRGVLPSDACSLLRWGVPLTQPHS
jgi:hypothetical protein